MACSVWNNEAGLILYGRQYPESDALPFDRKILWSWIGIWVSVVVPGLVWTKNQEDWQIIMMINRADEFSS